MASIVFSTRAWSSGLLSMVPSTESLAILAHFCFRLAWYLEELSPRIYSVGRISFDYTKKPRLFARRGFESRFRKSEQDDKWSFCLTTAIVAVNRRNHEQTTPPEPLTGLQGEGGSGRRQGRSHNRPAGRAFRRSPLSDHSMEIAA